MILATKSATALSLVAVEPFETKATAATAHRPIAIVKDDDAVDEFAMRVSGYASTWDPDLGGDMITRGAFREGLAEWRANGQPIQFVDFHNYTGLKKILGRVIDAHEDDTGLLTTFGIVRGQETEHARELVKTKSITGLSIGYRVPRGGQREPDARLKALGVTRILDKIALHEVSLVMSPMNPHARVTSDGKGLGPDDPKRLALNARLESLIAGERDRKERELAELRAKHAKLKAWYAEHFIAPDDPRRIALDAKLRELQLRRLRSAIA